MLTAVFFFLVLVALEFVVLFVVGAGGVEDAIDASPSSSCRLTLLPNAASGGAWMAPGPRVNRGVRAEQGGCYPWGPVFVIW